MPGRFVEQTHGLTHGLTHERTTAALRWNERIERVPLRCRTSLAEVLRTSPPLSRISARPGQIARSRAWSSLAAIATAPSCNSASTFACVTGTRSTL
eukprot:7438716-Pyramimonas_sp.AAC.1